MNKLQIHAVRQRAACALHRRKALNGVLGRSRRAAPATFPRHDASTHRALPLRAQWFRHAVSGALECRWVPDAAAEPHSVGNVHFLSTARMHRRISRAGMRPPSR